MPPSWFYGNLTVLEGHIPRIFVIIVIIFAVSMRDLLYKAQFLLHVFEFIQTGIFQGETEAQTCPDNVYNRQLKEGQDNQSCRAI